MTCDNWECVREAKYTFVHVGSSEFASEAPRFASLGNLSEQNQQGQAVSPLHQCLDLWVNVVLKPLVSRIIWEECILVWEALLIRMGQFLPQVRTLTVVLEYQSTHLAFHHSAVRDPLHGLLSFPSAEKPLSVFGFPCFQLTSPSVQCLGRNPVIRYMSWL
jgi:hypothetical protein